jgi:GNAT superfamily N-acetyltransferase
MPDGSINVKITAETSGFVAGVNQVGAATQQLEVSQKQMAAALAQTNGNFEKALELLAKEADAAQAASAANVKLAQSAAQAAQSTRVLSQAEQEFVASLSRVQSGLGSFDESVAGINRASEAFQAANENAEGLTEAHGRLQFATAGTTREFLVLGHEAMTGNFNRIPGSIVVLLERMGSLHTIVSSLSGVWGVAAVAGVGALAAIGYAAYQAIEGVLALRDATDRLVQGGVGYEQAKTQAASFTRMLSSEYHETGAQIRAISDEFRNLPSNALASQEGFARLSEALAQLGHTTAAEEAKKVVQAVSGGPEAYEKWAEKILDTNGALAENGQLLRDYVKSLEETHRIPEAYDAVTRAIEGGAGGQAEARQKKTNALREYYSLAAAMGEGAMGGLSGLTEVYPKELPKEHIGEEKRPTPAQLPEVSAGLDTASDLTKEEQKRNTLGLQLNQLKNTQLALEGQIEGALMAGNNAAAQQLQTQLENVKTAQQRLEIEAANTHGAAETEQHAARMAKLQGELEAQRNNAQAVIAIRRQIADEVVRYEAEAIAKVHALAISERESIPVAEALPRAREEAAPLARQTPTAIAAENQYQSAVRTQREQEFKTWIDQMREAEAQAGKSGQQRVAIEEQVNAAIRAAAAEAHPLVNATAVEAADKHLAEVKKQAADEALQTTLRDLDEEARQHQKNADLVVEIEKKKRDAVRNLEIQRLTEQGKTPEEAGQLADQTPAVKQQINAVTDAERRAAKERLQSTIATERARADETESGSTERLATERHILELLQQAQQQELVGEGEVLAQKERVAAAERSHLNEVIRLIESDKSARLKALDEEITAARHNEAEIERLLRARIALIDETIAKEKKAREDAGVRLGPEAQQIQNNKDEGERSEGRKRLETQQQNYADQEARRAIKQLENQRRIIDQQEQADLHSVERRRSMGELTASTAAALEDRIVASHAAAVQQILAQEAAKAKGNEELENQIADRSAEVAQRDADKQREIWEKAEEERVKRAKDIDKELASSLTDAITGVMEHKESWGQAIAKFFEQQEKKLLEKTLQKLFDQSGIGELFGGLGDMLGFGDSDKLKPEDQLRLATGANTDATKANTDALRALSGAGAPGGAGGTPTIAGGQSPSKTAAESTAGEGPVPGSAAMQSQMYQWLLAHGYSPSAAAAVIGNAAAESHLRTDAVGKAGELGLFQENPQVGNRQAMEAYAASSGRSPTDWQVQMEFMDQQLSKLDPTFKKAGDAAGELAKRFEKNLERPKSLADAPRRADYANQVYAAQTGPQPVNVAQQTGPQLVNVAQVAGTTLSAPATPSGGGLPVTAAAPPSAAPVEPAAPTPATEQMCLPLAGGAPDSVPAFEQGGTVESTGLAFVHAGETIIPADAATAGVSAKPGFVEGIGQDFQDFFDQPIAHVQQQLTNLGDAFVGTANNYAGQVRHIQDAGNTGVPVPADDMASFVAEHLLINVPSGALSAGAGRAAAGETGTALATTDRGTGQLGRSAPAPNAPLPQLGFDPQVGFDGGGSALNTQITEAVSQGVDSSAPSFGNALATANAEVIGSSTQSFQSAIRSANADLIDTLGQTTATLDKFNLELAPPALAPALTTATATGNGTAAAHATDHSATQSNAQTSQIAQSVTADQKLTGDTADNTQATKDNTQALHDLQSPTATQATVPGTASGPGDQTIDTGSGAGTGTGTGGDYLGIAQAAYARGDITTGGRYAQLAGGSPIITEDTAAGPQQFFMTGEQTVSYLQDMSGRPTMSSSEAEAYMASRPDLFSQPYTGRDLSQVTHEGPPTTGYLSSPEQFGPALETRVNELGQQWTNYGRGFEPTSQGDDIGHLSSGQIVRTQDLLHNQSLRDAYANWEANPTNRSQAMTQGENPVFDEAASQKILAEQAKINPQSPLTTTPANVTPAATQQLPSDVPSFDDGGPVDETGLALLHEGEYVVPADVVNAAPDRSDPLKLGGGPATVASSAVDAAMRVAGVSDTGSAMRSLAGVVPALQRGDTTAAIGTGLSGLASAGMVLGMGAGKEAKAAEALDQAARKIADTSVHDAYHGELFGTKSISENGQIRAAADLSIYGDDVQIQNIHTREDARRQGSATALVNDLFREFPDKKIRLSMMTDEGASFFRNTYDIDRDGYITSKGAAPGAGMTPPAPSGHVALDTTDETLHQLYPLAGESVDGRTVRAHTPNQDSIGASFGNYEVLSGVREVPLSYFSGKPEITERTTKLAADINQSAELDPLIVAVDSGGPYILEGGHRYDALQMLGAKSFPAHVVLDLDDLPDTLPSKLPHLAAGGTVTQSGAAVVHAGEIVLPASTITQQQPAIATLQPQQNGLGKGWEIWAAAGAAMLALFSGKGGLGGLFGGGDKGQDPSAQATDKNTAATDQNTQALLQHQTDQPQAAPATLAPGNPAPGREQGAPATPSATPPANAAATQLASVAATPTGTSGGGLSDKLLAAGFTSPEGPQNFIKGTLDAANAVAQITSPIPGVPTITANLAAMNRAQGWTGFGDTGNTGNPLVINADNPLGTPLTPFEAGSDWSSDVPSFDDGGPVEQTGLALVHQGEFIIPADQVASASDSPAAGFTDPFHPIAQIVARVFGQPIGEQYRGLTGAPDPTDPDDPRRAPNWSSSAGDTSADGDWSSDSMLEGAVIPSAAGGAIVVPGEIAPVATQGSASPTLPPIPGLGKGWEIWAALLALLMMLMGKGGQKGQASGATSQKTTPLAAGSAKLTGPTSAQISGLPGGSAGDLSTADAADLGGQLAAQDLGEADAAELGGELVAQDFGTVGMADIGTGFPDVADVHEFAGGGVIPSAAGGLQVHETALPQAIKSGVRALAAKGDVAPFAKGRLTSALGGAPVADGKGGQIAVVHPGEMILPAAETSQVLGAMSSEGGAIVPPGVMSAAGGTVVGLPEQQTVSSLGFVTPTLVPANPQSNLAGLTQILALLMALQKLMGSGGLLGGLFGGGGQGGQGGGGQGGQGGGGLFGWLGGLFGGGGSGGGGAGTGVQGLTTAANQAAPALQGLTGSTTTASSGLTGFSGLLGSLFSGGQGGGGGGIIGGVLGFVPKILGGLFALEKGGVIPSAAGGMVVGGMMVGGGGAVADGKGGRLIVAHPNEMVLPAPISRGLQNLIASAAPPPPDGGLGRILGMTMMGGRQIPHFAQGAWEVDRDMVGLLHHGEQVIPSSFAEGLRGASGGGSPAGPSVNYGDTHVHLSAIDSRSGAAFLMAHSDTIAKSFFRAHRNNSRFTPGG